MVALRIQPRPRVSGVAPLASSSRLIFCRASDSEMEYRLRFRRAD